MKQVLDFYLDKYAKGYVQRLQNKCYMNHDSTWHPVVGSSYTRIRDDRSRKGGLARDA